MYLGIAISIATAIIIFGGVKRIARAVEYIVPVMAVAYVAVALFVLIKNFTMIPSVIESIVSNALGFKQAVGGGLGVVIMQGVKRGLFSNEAGMGSAPNAAATAKDVYEYYFANDKTKKTLEKNNKSVTETSVGTAGD